MPKVVSIKLGHAERAHTVEIFTVPTDQRDLPTVFLVDGKIVNNVNDQILHSYNDVSKITDPAVLDQMKNLIIKVFVNNNSFCS